MFFISCVRAVTALITAAYNGHTPVVRELLAAGADINAKLGDGSFATALILASRNGHTDVVQLLEQAGGQGYRPGE
jgi:ankyrin repeat protein